MLASHRTVGHATHSLHAYSPLCTPLLQLNTLHVSQSTLYSQLLLHPHTTCPHHRLQQLKPAAVGDERGTATTVSEPQKPDSTGSAGGAAAVDAAGPGQQQQSWVWEESGDGAAAYAAFFLWLALGSWPALQSLNIAGQSVPSGNWGWVHDTSMRW